MKSREISWNFMKREELHWIPIKCVKILKIWDFYATETLETAESTKPYELLLQMDGFRARNHLFSEIQHFRENHTFPRKTDFARKSISGRETELSRRRGLRECQFRLIFCALKGSQIKCDGTFLDFWPPKWWKVVKMTLSVNSTHFMKIGGIHLKSAIFTTFHHFGG